MKKKLLSVTWVLIYILILFGISYKENEVIKLTEPAFYNTGKKEIIVAVVDTGLNLDDTIDGNRIITLDDSIADDIGHGTKIIQLIQNNTNDMVSIMPVKVTDANGSASIKSVCEGIKKAVDNGADIINLSMNTVFYDESSELEELVNELYDKGIYTIVSAGNESEDTKYLAPANIDKAIVVGAMTNAKEPYFFSNYGESVDIGALGLYDGDLGTSFASAYVTSYCANLLSKGHSNIESAIACDLKGTSDTDYGKGYLTWKGLYTGNNATESEIYLGKRDKTLNEKTCDILEIDWKNLSREELDAIIGETDYKYVGLLLSRLTETELEDISEKSHILTTSVNRLDTKYDEKNSEYVVFNEEEVDYIEYCLRAYKEEKEKMLLTSNWYCGTEEAVFYISSPDREKIYKYVLKGLKNHAWIEGINGLTAFKDSDLSILSSTYKNEETTYQFTKPTPTGLRTFTPSVRAHKVDHYKTDGTFINTAYNWFAITDGGDDGLPYVGISIEFDNYSNKKVGYHNSDSSIKMYNAGLGIGTSTTDAFIYTYEHGSSVSTAITYANFDTIIPGYVEYRYTGVFKDGYNAYNATSEDALVSSLYGRKDNIYLSSGQSSINDTTGTFTINIKPHIGLGTKWYQTSNGTLMAESDIPEFVFNLAPNTYTIKFNGNGATGGSTANQSLTYDTAVNLNANGFTKTGYVFAGWNTEANGTGTSFYDKQSVRNLAFIDGYTVNLYAQWKPNTYSMTLLYDGGTYNGNTQNTYTVTYGSSDYYCLSGVLPTKDGYTFNGFWTGNGLVPVYDKNGYCTNEGTYWLYNNWKNPGNATFIASWIPNTYNMTLLYNGGTYNGATENTYTVTYGSSNYSNLAGVLPARKGYTFNGFWTGNGLTKVYNTNGYCSNEGTYWSSSKWNTKANAAFIAKWTPITYKVKFNGNGATGGNTETQSMVYDTAYYLNENGYTKTGYAFAGWSTSPDGSVVFNDKHYVCNMAFIDGYEVTLYAQWIPNTYNMTLLHNGGTYNGADQNTYTVKYGSSDYNDMSSRIPIREGYIFNGYWTGNLMVQVYDENGKCTNEGTYWKDGIWSSVLPEPAFIAQWIPDNIDYTIKFDGNGATAGSTASMSMTSGVSKNLTANGFTKTGYTFKNWNTKQDGTGISYKDKQLVSNLSSVDGSEVILYAQWESSETTYKVNHYKENLDSAWSLGKTVHLTGYSDEKVDIDTLLEVFEGFTYKEARVNNIVKDKEEAIILADGSLVIDLYYTRNSYTVTLDKDNGIFSVSGAGTYKYGETVNINTIVKLGYSWNCWNGDFSSADKIYQFTMPASDVTMKANTDAVIYEITLDNQDADATGTQQYFEKYNTDNYSDAACINSITNIIIPQKKAYVFEGYFTETNGNGTQYVDSAGKILSTPTTFEEDTILYAYWIPITYIIQFEGNGSDEGSMEELYCIFDQEYNLPVNKFNKNLYHFAGWNTESAGSGTAYPEQTLIKNLSNIQNDVITLYAQWNPNTYEVCFDANGGYGSMDSVTFSCDTLKNLPTNLFTKENEYGPSTFLGWSTDAAATAATFTDEEEVMNIPGCEEGFLTLYAIWDDCPWIVTEDLYYSLYEAQNGLITYEELMSKAEAFDKEAGSTLLPGIDPEKGTSFTIIDYLATDFTQFTASGSVTETYQAIDSAGNIFKKRITVHIVDTTPVEILPEGTTRFINEKYYNESYENGGLEDNSIWKTDPEYVAVIQKAFDNLKNNTPIMSFSFTYEEVLEMKEFIRNNGLGNTRSSDALQRFYDIFMAPNMVNSQGE